MGTPNTYTISGILRNPPPTPKNPARMPVINPENNMTHNDIDSIPEAGNDIIGFSFISCTRFVNPVKPIASLASIFCVCIIFMARILSIAVNVPITNNIAT